MCATVSNTWNFGSFSTFVYTNDALARRTRRVDNMGVTNEFGYNGRSELTAAQMGTNRYGYIYDPIGNRTVSTNNAEVLTYLANGLNQYTNIADGVTNRPTYDLDGNMLACGGWTFAWDGENRLLAASNGTTSVSFGYDHMGRRFRKIVAGATTTTNTFLHDGWAMVREIRGGTTNAYVYGPDLSGSMQGAGTIGGLLFGAFGGTATVSSAFYAYDANGNVTTLIDTNGALVASYTYDPYGNTIAATGVLAAVNPFQFSTKYLDGETGLYYYGYRHYSPSLGRWLSRDPIGEAGGLPLYGFVGNAPVGQIDPFGLSVGSITVSIFTPVSTSTLGWKKRGWLFSAFWEPPTGGDWDGPCECKPCSFGFKKPDGCFEESAPCRISNNLGTKNGRKLRPVIMEGCGNAEAARLLQ
jgi:RHS repeat-associated protein